MEVKTVELDKMLAVNDESQKIGEFLQWLSEQDFILVKYSDEMCDCGLDQLSPTHRTKEQLLADYFNIDLDKCEAERQQILENLRNQNYKT